MGIVDSNSTGVTKNIDSSFGRALDNINKGYWWGDDKEKMDIVIKENKDIKIEIVMEEELIIYENKYL